MPDDLRLRSVGRVVHAVETLEGAGFRVNRPFPTRTLDHLDPFLLLDEMGPTDHGPGEAQGAPDHPHRGFETVTYVLAGELQHEDSQGNRGRLGPGDVQWMTAGGGVIHSEMPTPAFQKTGGRVHGFQLWVNLPAKDKMMKPRYQDVPAARIPEGRSTDGKVAVRVVAGEALGAKAVIDTRTPMTYLHFTIAPGGRVSQPVPAAWNAFAYVFGGEIRGGGEGTRGRLHDMMLFAGDGDAIALEVPADAAGNAEVLLVAGAPLGEPVARHGPFVMNTRQEIVQAIDDLESGRFGRIER